ncbi:MAG: hypothetical protein JSR61_19215 [Proteobacteria bacterium]|nr:hypothetical protein [Pseudomonadota bacterium]
MTTLVTLHVYSGRENPSWILQSSQEGQFFARMEQKLVPTLARPSGTFGGLGYQGFSITRHAEFPSAASRFFVHESIVEQGTSSPNLTGDPEIELLLLESGSNAVDGDLAQYVRAQIGTRTAFQAAERPEAAAGVCPPNKTADAPAYNPGIWNTPSVQPYNNCYNYANNNATNTFAQPGRASGHPTSTMACSHVTPAAESDGLRSVANFSGTLAAGAGWYVALVVWPNRDYHWYRQDNVGCWSHKPGQTAARNVDNSGRPIADPQSCDRGPYSNFCTYMVTKRGIRIS